MLPLISSFTDASSGPQGYLSNATADMIWPDVQYPHWYPSQAKNAACRGCKLSGVPRPSMVVISSPSCITASVRHEFTRLPFTCTVHAPHCPWSQPFFVPVNWSRSRSISNSDARTSTVIACGVLFTVKLMVLSVTCIVFLLKMASHSYCSILELTFCPIPLVALGLLPYPAGHGHTGEFKVCLSHNYRAPRFCPSDITWMPSRRAKPIIRDQHRFIRTSSVSRRIALRVPSIRPRKFPGTIEKPPWR